MATYTISVTLNTSSTPPVTVNTNCLSLTGLNTITWVPAANQSGWTFGSISFNPNDILGTPVVASNNIAVVDDDDATTTQTISYTLTVLSGTSPYSSDPYILNQPTGQ